MPEKINEPDMEYVVPGDGRIVGNQSVVDEEATVGVLLQFDRYHPGAVEALGRVIVPRPDEKQ